ncbi:MAG: fibrobacter succinogenes major paralogous domain-containing protein [Fibrobacter sp.]|nr:fibrobacter succinogenes major paralogous domain-containing protein [Fibrobacter sp.]
MGKILVTVGLLVVCSMAGTLKDSRDGQTYKTVQIGNQVWMAENLNYKTSGSACYDNEESNCEKYGRLYTWESAKKACPAGWHLPSKEEFERLLYIVGGASDEITSINLRARSWKFGSEMFGFSALPAGSYNSRYKEFGLLGFSTYIWSSTEENSDYAYSLYVEASFADVGGKNMDGGGSVRCLQDSEAQPPSGTLKDSRDGQTYKTMQIFGRVWMAENLNYKTSESECYDNKESNCKKYGRLYTWESAKKACPAGWRLPSHWEFKILRDNAGGASDEIKSINLRARSWRNGADKFGFSALPAGYYDSNDKKFDNLGNVAIFWSSTTEVDFGASLLGIDVGRPFQGFSDRDRGHSVRCLQD